MPFGEFGGVVKTRLAPADMTDGSSKEPSKGFLKAPKNWLKKTFSSRSSSLQPSPFGQENRSGELSSGQHAIISSGPHWIDPVIDASPALTQRGIFHASLSPRIKRSTQHADHRTPAQLSRSQPSSSSSGLPGSAVAHGSIF